MGAKKKRRPKGAAQGEAGGKKSFWRKPATWIVGLVSTLVVSAVGYFGLDYFKGVSGNAISSPLEEGERAASPEPFEVMSVSFVHNPVDYIVPPDKATAAAVDLKQGKPIDSAWATKNSVTPVGVSIWEIILDGRRSTREVAIVDIEPVLENGRCQGKPEGLLMAQTSSGVNKYALSLEVDRPDAKLMDVDEDSGEVKGPYFSTKNIPVKTTEPSIIRISAHAKAGYCRWTLKASYYADGVLRSKIITAPDGKPFSVLGEIDYSDYSAAYLSPMHCQSHGWTKVTGLQVREMRAGKFPC